MEHLRLEAQEVRPREEFYASTWDRICPSSFWLEWCGSPGRGRRKERKLFRENEPKNGRQTLARHWDSKGNKRRRRRRLYYCAGNKRIQEDPIDSYTSIETFKFLLLKQSLFLPHQTFHITTPLEWDFGSVKGLVDWWNDSWCFLSCDVVIEKEKD